MGALLTLERELAGAMSLADLTGSILDGLQRAAGASGSTLFWFEQPGVVRTSGGSLEQVMRGYTQDLFHEDALQQWALRLPPSSFLSDEHQPDGTPFDLASHVASRPYADFYRPHDIAYVLALWPTGLRYGTPGMFGVLLTTPPPFRPFDAKAIAKLRHLEVPLRTAARRIARFSAVEQKGAVVAELLERQNGASVLWDPEGRLSWISPAAQQQLAGTLRRSDLLEAARLALRQLRNNDPSLRQTLLGRPCQIRSAHGVPLRVAFSWIAGPDGRPWLLGEIEEGGGARALLAQLTQAETRVLRLLTQGLSNSEICDQLQVSKETVKTHVRRILLKLGTSSRAKAVALAHEAWSWNTAPASNGRTDASSNARSAERSPQRGARS